MLPSGCSLITHFCRESTCFTPKVVPEMKELVQDLRARGWRVVIVTASPTWIVEPGARLLGLGPHDILGIEVQMSTEVFSHTSAVT